MHVCRLLIRFNGEIEAYLLRRMPRANFAAAASLLRLLRRGVDVLIVFAGLIAVLRYFQVDPTPALAGLGVIKKMLDDAHEVDPSSSRVTFVGLGAFSFDVEVFAYLFARDANHFLAVQERLLFGVTEIVARAGTEIALPSQTMYVSGGAAPARGEVMGEARSFLPAQGGD